MPQHRDSSARYIFLDYLRALAAWLVVWDHLAATMPGWLGRTFQPAQWLRNNIAGPLGIIQDFGWFGVALFFLISGFIISDRARVEGVREFVVRRVLRIYPMLAIAVTLSVLFLAPKDQATPANIALNLTLANYLMIPQVVLLGVAWTLVIEVAFYALTALTQFARSSPHRVAFNLAVVALLIWKHGAFGPSVALLAAAASYLPVLVMGQTVYWWLAMGRLSAPWGVAYLVAAYGVFLWGLRAMQPAFLPVTNSYLISVAFALLLFICLMRSRLPERPIVRLLSNTSYSLYLLHGIIAPFVLAAVLKRAPLSVAILSAAVASLAAAYVSYRLVELPLQALARRLSRSWRPASVVLPPTAAAPANAVKAAL